MRYVVKNDNVKRNTKPIQGFKKSWKYGWCRRKSTVSLEENNKKAHGAPIEKRILGLCIHTLIWSVMAAMDSLMALITKTFHQDNEPEWMIVLAEYSALYIIFVAPGMFFGWVWWTYIGLPLSFVLNTLRRKYYLK
jgi:hypothetical protein